MSIYQEDPRWARRSILFREADPLDAVGSALLFVPFDSDGRGRRPVTEPVPAHPGLWIFAYSTRGRMAQVHGDGVDYSEVAGYQFLAQFASAAGLWLDFGHLAGRKITLPPHLSKMHEN
jgi:hypothetical protein